MIPLYQCYGDVYVVEYSLRRFERLAAMRAAYQYACDNGYENIVLVGTSLGGEECLMFVEYARACGAKFANAMVMLPADVPLNADHLIVPVPPVFSKLTEWLKIGPFVRITKYIHVGPLFNLLSPLVARAAFRRIKHEETDGVNQGHWDRHMNMMWRCRLSVVVEQIAAIAWMWPFTNVRGVPTVYLRCVKDDVIHGQLAVDSWTELLGKSLLEVVDVEGGHVQLVENHRPWLGAYIYALELLRNKGFILAA